MSLHSFTSFSQSNRRMIFLLIMCHLLWSCASFGLLSIGGLINVNSPFWSGLFIALQLYSAAQLLLPVLLFHPEERNRGFYLFWGILFIMSVWLVNQLAPAGLWGALLTVFKSSLLLLTATLVGAAMARYIHRLWEIVPVCVVMTLADFASWLYGPTAGFSQEIQKYYLAPEGPPPLVDMVLIKFAFPGYVGMAPVFGVSDWIMVVFFALVANHHDVNDNLVGPTGESLARQGRIGRYLPVSVAALFIAMTLAQTTGLFVPALPVIALAMLLWYAGRYFLYKP